MYWISSQYWLKVTFIYLIVILLISCFVFMPFFNGYQSSLIGHETAKKPVAYHAVKHIILVKVQLFLTHERWPLTKTSIKKNIFKTYDTNA